MFLEGFQCLRKNHPPEFSNVDLNFKGSTYKLHYKKDGDQLIVTRIAKLNRDNIAPVDYSQFKNFFNAIVEAESKYVVFK
jgi:hypothetical protein